MVCLMTPIAATKFEDNPYQTEWFERDYLATPMGRGEFPKHDCKRTFELSFPFIRRMRTAVDIGCRVGEYSRYLQHYFAWTYAFDPNLWKEFSTNVDLSKVTHFNCALGDERGTINMYGGTHQQVDGKKAKKVAVHRLDDFELEDVDYIKIDVEGFERKVLMGAAKTVEKYRPLIVIEQNEVRLPDEEPLAAKGWLEERGYRHVATCPRGWDYIMVCD
jgi:FkbM family methyltransferase